MQIEFKPLKDIPKQDIIELLNHPLVRRHMPLAKDDFDDQAYDKFIAAKQKLWDDHGYGPWALIVDQQFVGWGGLQYEEGDADLALVLHPKHWGLGKVLFDAILQKSIKETKLDSITALLPPSRTRTKGMLKLGFQPDGELIIHGERFIRYRLFCHSKS